MQREEIKQISIQIVSDQMGVSLDKITEETNLANDLGADSLDMVELVFEFEDEFDLSIDDEDAEKLNTVKDIIDYVEEHA